jgi:hypothetical protein
MCQGKVLVFIFHPKNNYRMILDTSKKKDLQKRETEKERKHITERDWIWQKEKNKHITSLEQYIKPEQYITH